MKFFIHVCAEVLVFLHVVMILIILFGWLFPNLFYLYGLALLTTILSWVFYKRCILVDIEYWLRKRLGVQRRPEENSFLVYWGHKFFGENAPGDRFVLLWGGIFLGVSMFVWVCNVVLMYPSFFNRVLATI